MLTKRIREIWTWSIVLGVLAIAGCHSSPNAAPGHILPNYQPDVPVNPQTTTSERKGPNEFLISLIRKPDVVAQENPDWCWAASVAALLNYGNVTNNGSPWTQDDIIRAMVSHKSDQSAGEEDVMLALTPKLMQQYRNAKTQFEKKPHREGILIVNGLPNNSGHFEANTPSLPDAQGLVDALAKGDPVIVAIDPVHGLLGHVVVATGVRYSMASTDVEFGTAAPYFIHEIFAIDPHDGQPTNFTANKENGENISVIDRVSFAVSCRVAQEYVTGSIRAYQRPVWVPQNTSTNFQPQQQQPRTKTIKLKF
jgi:hypothetical protein